MREIDTKISKHAKDIIQKYTSGLFRDTTLEFYGVKTAKIKELINVELPVVEVAETRTDFIFLLEDNTYLHIEFQSSYNKSDLIRFAAYDMRLFKRDGRSIRTVVIYTADVKKVPVSLNIGSLVYDPDIIMMGSYDGNQIYNGLEKKIEKGIALTDVDMLNLIFLPLMGNDIPKYDLATRSIKLAQTIPDKGKRNTCIASVFAFANRYLDENGLSALLEVLRMTDLATMLIEDAVSDERIEIAKKAIREGLAMETIEKITGLTDDIILQLQDEVNHE